MSVKEHEGFDTEAVEKLATKLRGEVLTQGEAGYDETRALWNGMIDKHPAIIARATGTADVVAVVNFAREQGVDLAIHGGGHNVAGKAVVEGGLMLDLSPMHGVMVDPERRRVRAQGGATLGDVDHETQLHGLATPLGVVTETGIAGLTLNGGYGHLSREYGLAIDNLTAVEIVTADGEVRTASETEHADLFWALRGGGGNFGVVTAFEYALHPVGPDVYGVFAWFHGDEAGPLLARFREWSASAPRNVGLLPFLGHVPDLEEFPASAWGEPAVVVFGCVRESAADAEALLAPLFEGFDRLADLSGPTTFEALQAMLDEDYPDGLRYYWKSIYLTELTDEVVIIMDRFNEASPSALSTVDLWWLDGAVQDVPQDATAFWHRDKPFMVTFEANWEGAADDDANVEWARDGFAALEALDVAGGRYGNFPGFAEDPTDLLFGENYQRLREVKRTYDPENLFRLNQNIDPETAEA